MNKVSMIETPAVSETSERLKVFTTDMGYVRVPVKVKTKKEENKKPKKATIGQEENSADAALDSKLPSELREPRWSVVSFENRVASNLSYEEASKKLKSLEAKKISGLCIITDEAAQRIAKKAAK